MSRWRTESVYLGRYAGSGSLNTLSGFAVIFLLMWLGLAPLWSNVAGYIVGFFLGFILSRKFVFRSNGHFVTESFRYLIAFMISFLVNLLVLRLSLDAMKLHVVTAQVFAAGSYTLLMYLLTRSFVFDLHLSGNAVQNNFREKIQRHEKLRLIQYIAIVLIAIIPISAFFYHELGALPKSVRMLAGAGSAGVFILAAYLMRMHICQLGTAKLSIVALAAALGIFLSDPSEVHFPSADYATLNYSDGSHTEHVKPSQIMMWGRSVDGYSLHPSYGSVRVPDSLIGEFSSTPNKLNILFSKPQAALLQPSGIPTLSDGISVEVNAFDVNGQMENSQKFEISQEEFLKNRWVEKTIKAPSGIAKVKITISSGPPGSTPSYDSTLVSFEVRNTNAYLLGLGKMLLVGFAFLSVALYAVLSIKNFSFTRILTKTSGFLRRGLPYISLLLLLILIAYWSASRTSFVYFWDYRNYWQKTEALHELMISGAWKLAMGVVVNSFPANYSMLPAVMPAMVSLFAGYPTRLIYLLTIISIYAVPAYIMVAYLARRLLEGGLTSQLHNNRNAWAFSSLPVFFGIPIYFSITLYLMPDMGGVVLFVAALLCASSLMKAITNEPENINSWKTSKDLLRTSLGLGILFSVMFLFRRWYIFAAVGIACSCIILISIESWINRKHWRNIWQRLAVAIIFIAFSALPFLSWVLFEWSHNIEQHDYSNLYSAYKWPLSNELDRFLSTFGLITPTLCLVFLILVRRLNPDRYLLFILVASSIIASVLFLQVQSPGGHHYYLLMPLLGASLAALSLILFRRYGLSAAVSFSMVLMLGSGYATFINQGQNGMGVLFPKYAGWLPKQQPYAKSYEEIVRWLLLPENKQKKFCLVASSPKINEGVFNELWQIIPDVPKNSLDGRLIHLGQVDSANGPPADDIKQCAIALVGVPFQTHLKTGEQYSLKIVQEDLVNGTGIGAAFGRVPKVFFMDDNIKMLAYDQRREITDGEYEDLVKRFLIGKGPDYVNPRKLEY
jgi:putative flippase GtrA